MPSADTPRLRLFVRTLVAAALALALGFHFVTAHRQRQVVELMRVENRLLDQENRLLHQQLEAERLQSAALTRLLKGAPERTAAPPVQAGP